MSKERKKYKHDITSDLAGKHIVYRWLREEGELSIQEIYNRIGLTHRTLRLAFEEPHKRLSNWQIERIAYCLPNRTLKEIKIALAEPHSISLKWYESNPNEE